MSKKKLFSIPSIGDMKEFERKKPEVKSHFKAGSNIPESSTKDGKNPSRASSSSSSSGKQTSAQSSGTNKSNSTKPTDSNTNSSNSTNTTSTGKRLHNSDVEVQLPVIKLTKTHEDMESPLRTSQEIEKTKGGGIGELPGGTSRLPDDNSGLPADGGTSGMPSLKRKLPGGNNHGQGTGGNKVQSHKLTAVPTTESTAAGPSKAVAPNSIVVNPRQRGNPILKHIRNVPWQFGDIVPDYVMGRTVCALYLSLRYHHLNPNYIHDRLKELGHNYELRVLLVQVDVKDPHHSLKELARMAILADCTLLLAWSAEEAGRYLETYKAYENKPADALKEKIEQDFVSRMQDCLTTVKSVKKNDVVTLLTTFGTLDKIMEASKEDLSLVPGFGSLKAQRLHSIFHEPFIKNKQKKKPDE